MGKKADYGLGHEAFLEYVQFIINHPAYAGMPDLYKDDGSVQWEAPSNRGSGKYKDTNQRRRQWWAVKAQAEGLNPNVDTAWLSRTAKRIHPTKRKPCKKCGLEMDLRYFYPCATLIRRFAELPFLNGMDQISPLEDIMSLVQRLHLKYGSVLLAELPRLLKAKDILMLPAGVEIDGWLKWIEEVYVPSEPSTLSPGAMSNAPDRLDGFHSFNLCHRSSADTGRHKENLASYVTDRRVFELWVDGDWIAADHLMGAIRSNLLFQKAGCFYASVHAAVPPMGNSTADHVGPISLGFCHRAEFQLLCQSCNSAKNNRVRVEDIQRLLTVEAAGSPVISWYAKAIWDLRKCDVYDEDTALRLAKILRDNRYTYMVLLSRILSERRVTFLCSLLNLQYAEQKVEEFKDLKLANHMTTHSGVVYAMRTSKYVLEQKARRIRVAFSSLREYANKKARNAIFITSPSIEAEIIALIDVLKGEPVVVRSLDEKLGQILFEDQVREGELRNIIHRIEFCLENGKSTFALARYHLEYAMSLVADELSRNWNDPRYSRILDLADF